MKKLIELRKEILEEKENARRRLDDILSYSQRDKYELTGAFRAFSDVLKKLDLILNNSCVKPTDSRSPEGQGEQSGVSRPLDSQNPKEDIYGSCYKCGRKVTVYEMDKFGGCPNGCEP